MVQKRLGATDIEDLGCWFEAERMLTTKVRIKKTDKQTNTKQTKKMLHHCTIMKKEAVW